MWLAVPLALAAAFCFAVCTVMQHAESGRLESHGPRLLAELLGRPVFLASVVVEGLALVFQALATGAGTVALVQPLLVTGLLFAVLLSARAAHRRVTAREGGGAVVCVLGLALFLLSSRPADGVASLAFSRAAVAAAPVAAIALVAVLLARSRPASRSGLLAVCGGVLLGLSAVLLKLVMHLLRTDGPGVVVSWQLAALLVSGVAGTIAAQNAFQAGELPLTIAILTLAEPLTAITLGASVLQEHLASSPSAIALESLAVVLSAAGVVLMSPPRPRTGLEPEVCNRRALASETTAG